MSPAATALLIELVIVPVIKDLLERRGIHGVTKENLESFAEDPEKVLTALAADRQLQATIVEMFADGIDNVLGDIVGGLGTLFAAVVPGGRDAGD